MRTFLGLFLGCIMVMNVGYRSALISSLSFPHNLKPMGKEGCEVKIQPLHKIKKLVDRRFGNSIINLVDQRRILGPRNLSNDLS